MFLHSFVDLDGLTSDEVLARLLFWWFGPSFAVLFLTLLIGSARTPEEAGYLGIALTAVVVWRDARHARIERPWVWALLAGVVPLFG